VFLIPLLVLVGGAIWMATAKATNTTPTPAPNVADLQAQAAEANAFIAQGRALGLSTAQIQDAWATGLSPQEYSDGVVNAPPLYSTAIDATAEDDSAYGATTQGYFHVGSTPLPVPPTRRARRIH
jgi:hypothetical protein